MARPKFIAVESQLKKLGFSFIAGVDEAGRGPLAGPVVSAAVILKPGARIPGLTDSKKLTEKKRDKLFQLVIKNSIDFAITVVPHQVIDEINILNATRLAHKLSLENLQIKPDIAIIDGRDKQITELEFLNFIKGDLHVRSIAAASILAKVARDTIMKQYHHFYPEYDFKAHMGYGTRKHRSVLSKIGPSPIHRLTFNYKTAE